MPREDAPKPRVQGPRLSKSEPHAQALVRAIHAGEIEPLTRLLREHPGLAAARLVDENGGSGTPLHAATDWPGFFPRGPEVVAALIDGGADIEAVGASIAGGTPLDDAVGYGCWQVARLLVASGARVDRLWHAAALGMISRVDELLAARPATRQELTDAFWQACHGGQRRMAEHLLALGAELNGTPSWADDTPLDVAEGCADTGREALVTWLREQGAEKSAKGPT